MPIKLRQYQEDALSACRDAYHRGVHRVLVSLATGLGKTVVLSSMPKYVIPKKEDCTVVLVNRDELVGQTLEKIEAVSPGAYSGIEKGAQRAKGDEEFIVASVYTLHERRIDEFFRRMKGRVGLLIADEAHHAAAPQYARIFEKFFKERPDGFLVGVTATPQRGDGIGLGSAFDETVYHRDMRWAIQEGWLVPIRCYNVATDTNLDSVETRMGDFAPEQLAKVIDDVHRNNIAVSSYLEHGNGKKGIVFAPTVAHARHIHDVFVARGVRSQWANGMFKKSERERIIDEFRSGKLDVLINVALFIEGFDVPDVEVMVGIRPTQSRAMFIQMCGRILRPDTTTAGLISRASTAEERRKIIASSVKPTALLLDLVDQTQRLGLMSLPTLWGLPPKFRLHGESIEEVKQAVEELEAYDPIAAYDLMTRIDQQQTDSALTSDETAVIVPEAQVVSQANIPATVKPEAPVSETGTIREELTKVINDKTMRSKTVFEHIATKLAEVSAFAPPIVDESISAVSSLAWRQSTVAEDDFYLDLPERRTAFHKDGTVIKDFGRIYRECEETARKTKLKFEEHLQERCPHDPESVRVAQDSVRIHRVGEVYRAEFSQDGEVKVLGEESNVARAFGRTERWIENNRRDIVSALSARAPWRAKQPTVNQITLLREEFNVPLHLVPANRGEADMLIKKLLDERGGRIGESATS